jgi:hypothetical protein
MSTQDAAELDKASSTGAYADGARENLEATNIHSLFFPNKLLHTYFRW